MGPLKHLYYYTGTGDKRFRTKYNPHQGKRECRRRLRQIAYGRLSTQDAFVSTDAMRASRVISNWI